MAMIAWGAAILALPHAPMVGDLYNLLYADSRPQKPEHTLLFLFGFPAMLAAIYALSRFRPDFLEERHRQLPIGDVGQAAFVISVTAIMAGMTLYRAYRVLAP